MAAQPSGKLAVYLFCTNARRSPGAGTRVEHGRWGGDHADYWEWSEERERFEYLGRPVDLEVVDRVTNSDAFKKTASRAFGLTALPPGFRFCFGIQHVRIPTVSKADLEQAAERRAEFTAPATARKRAKAAAEPEKNRVTS